MNESLKTRLIDFKSQKNRLMGRLLSKSFRFLSDLASEQLREKGYDTFRLGHLISLIHIDVDGSTINELAAMAGITKQAVSKIVRELQDAGYVQTEKHPGDARSVVVTISDKGAQFMLDWKECTVVIDERFRAILGAERLDLLKDLLFELVDYYETQLGGPENGEMLRQKAPWIDIMNNKTVAIADQGDLVPQWGKAIVKTRTKPS